MLLWRKLASAKWEDAWVERLTFLGPTRLAVVRLPNRKSLRIEAYNLTRVEADGLLAEFGGQIREAPDRILPDPVPRSPLAIRNRLWIVDCAQAAEAARVLDDRRPVVIVPAAMAFGTGDHATTASCLRLLCDLAGQMRGRWDFLDLGTGSGILAIAARKLGASRAEGHDYDPHAVRTAKENVARNDAGPLPIRKTDVLKWTPLRTWDVVAANLFSQVLIASSAKITAAVRPGGHLILSGILRIQEEEVVQTFLARGFRIEQIVHRGKWVTLMAVKAGGTPQI